MRHLSKLVVAFVVACACLTTLSVGLAFTVTGAITAVTVWVLAGTIIVLEKTITVQQRHIAILQDHVAILERPTATPAWARAYEARLMSDAGPGLNHHKVN